jgi:hypothetical protein
MNTLIIKDLAITEELDSKAMADVRGGFCGGYKMPSCHPYQYQPNAPSSSSTTTVTVDQSNELYQSNATGNGSATFGGGIQAWNNQQGGNYIGGLPVR